MGGELVRVDADMVEELAKYNWYLGNHGYAVRDSGRILMHRVINDTPKGKHTDHINSNKRDNRSANLRTATREENAQNTRRKNKSGYRGVYPSGKKFSAVCGGVYLGNYLCAVEAAKVYDLKAIELHGAFAVRNFI